jgi:serine/threonine-protein kinase
MEFIEGKSVGEILEKTGPLDPARVEHVLKQVVGSLEEAHGRGIVHRDLKPENVILTDKAGKKDWVEVLDFGIAKRSTEEDPNEAKLTQQGMVLGTPPYMSPEQFTGRPIDARSDIYALGVMTYEMLTGRLPFEAQTAWEWATQHMTAQPKPIEVQPGGDQIPPQMRTAIMRSLSKHPSDRFASVTEFYEAFALGLASSEARAASIPARPASTAGAATGAVRQSSGTQVGEPIDPAMLGGPAVNYGGQQGYGAAQGGQAYGAPQGQAGYPSATPNYQGSYAQPPPQQARGGGGKGALIAVAAAVGALSLGVGGFALMRSSKPAPLQLDLPTNAMTSTSASGAEAPAAGAETVATHAGDGTIPALNDGKKARERPATTGVPGVPTTQPTNLPTGTQAATPPIPTGQPTLPPPTVTAPPQPTSIPVMPPTAPLRNEFACNKVATARTTAERAMWVRRCNKK